MTMQTQRPGQQRPMGPGGGGPGGFMGGGPRPGMGSGEKARDFKGTWGKLLDYLKPFRASMVVVFIFAIASTVFTIVGPKILGKATTKLFEGVMAQIAGTG